MEFKKIQQAALNKASAKFPKVNINIYCVQIYINFEIFPFWKAKDTALKILHKLAAKQAVVQRGEKTMHLCHHTPWGIAANQDHVRDG